MKYQVKNAARWTGFEIGQIVDLAENEVVKTLAPWGSEVLAMAANEAVVVEAHTLRDPLELFIEKLPIFCTAFTTAVVYFPDSGEVFTGNPGAFIGKRGKRVQAFKEEGVKISAVKHLRELHGDPIWKRAKALPWFEKYWGGQYTLSISQELASRLGKAIMVGCGVKTQ